MNYFYYPLIIGGVLLAITNFYLIARIKKKWQTYYIRILITAIVLGFWGSILTSFIEILLQPNQIDINNLLQNKVLGRRVSGGLLTIILYFKFVRNTSFSFLNLFLVSALLGMSIGKLGCYIDEHYSCFGSLNGTIYPLPLVDAVFYLSFFIVSLYVLLKLDLRRKEVNFYYSILVIFCAYHIVLEFVRNTPKSLFDTFSINQVIYALLAAFLIFKLILHLRLEPNFYQYETRDNR